jgi:hypothetical protein
LCHRLTKVHFARNIAVRKYLWSEHLGWWLVLGITLDKPLTPPVARIILIWFCDNSFILPVMSGFLVVMKFGTAREEDMPLKLIYC